MGANELIAEVIAYNADAEDSHYDWCYQRHAGCLAVMLRDAEDTVSRSHTLRAVSANAELIARAYGELAAHKVGGNAMLVRHLADALEAAEAWIAELEAGIEWEYQCTNNINTTGVLGDPEIHAKQCAGRIERRRKAGQWQPVESDGDEA